MTDVDDSYGSDTPSSVDIDAGSDCEDLNWSINVNGSRTVQMVDNNCDVIDNTSLLLKPIVPMVWMMTMIKR